MTSLVSCVIQTAIHDVTGQLRDPDDDVTGQLNDPDGPSVPTKLLVNGRRQLIVGYRRGLVLVFDTDTQTVVCSLAGHQARVNTLLLLATQTHRQWCVHWLDTRPVSIPCSC